MAVKLSDVISCLPRLFALNVCIQMTPKCCSNVIFEQRAVIVVLATDYFYPFPNSIEVVIYWQTELKAFITSVIELLQL